MHTGIFDAGQPWTSWCFAAKESFLLSADSPAAHDALLEPVTVPHTADIKHLALNQAPRGFVAPQHLPELPQPIFQGPLGPAPCPRSRGGFLCSAEQRDAIRSTAWAPACPTCLLEIVQAMLVAVGDVEGIEVLQGTSLIRQPHGGDAFQDLIQLLLTRGLKRAEKTERQITQCNPKSV